jgi:hypothetical protein
LRKSTPPKYNVAVVEAVILELAVRLHPRCATADELTRTVVGDPSDTRETDTAAQAIRGLREVGLFSDGDDKIVEPTPAGLRAVAILNPPSPAPIYPQN